MRGGDADRPAASGTFTTAKSCRSELATSGSHSRRSLPHILCRGRQQRCRPRTARIVRLVMPARLTRTQRTRRVRSGTGRIFERATLGRRAAADALQVPEPNATAVGATVAGTTRATTAVTAPVLRAWARITRRLVSRHSQHRKHRQQQHSKRPGRATNHRHDRDLRQGSGPRGIAHRDGSFTVVPDVSLIAVMSRAMRSLTAGARIGREAERCGSTDASALRRVKNV
jgi:general stress protein YciG